MRKETLLFSWAAALSAYINAFTPESQRLQQFQSPSRSLSSSVSLGALPPNYEDIGTQIIQDAGISCGMKSLEDLEIEWGVARVVVTVRGKVHLSTPDEVGEPSDEDGEDDELPDPEAVSGVDITQLARAINFALGEDEVGNAIAETHEIEVTTAGASDHLSGIMFEAYKGFDVICRFEDPKKRKMAEIQGRLYDRTDEITVINMKGRMKKIKNELIEFVRLPKAKKEKGSK